MTFLFNVSESCMFSIFPIRMLCIQDTLPISVCATDRSLVQRSPAECVRVGSRNLSNWARYARAGLVHDRKKETERGSLHITDSSITKNFCVLHNTVEHNYISPSSTVETQLHVSALYEVHLQVVI